MIPETQRGRGTRWLKFNAVGGIGIVVQLMSLAILKSALHVHYLIATAVAVEVTVLHNYVWHERFTWVTRKTSNRFARALKFNLSNGAISLLGNIVLMRWLVGSMRVHYLVANGITIAICSTVNFLVSDNFVFEAKKPAAIADPIDYASVEEESIGSG